jgi:hypothetical protein
MQVVLVRFRQQARSNLPIVAVYRNSWLQLNNTFYSRKTWAIGPSSLLPLLSLFFLTAFADREEALFLNNDF